MTYYLWLNNTQTGPFTIGQLRSMWQTGSVTSLTLFWKEGMKDWKPLIDIVQLIETQGSSLISRNVQSPPQSQLVQPQVIYVQKESSTEETSPSGCSWVGGIFISLFIPILGLICGVLIAASKKDRALAIPMVLISLVSMIVYYLLFFASVR